MLICPLLRRRNHFEHTPNNFGLVSGFCGPKYFDKGSECCPCLCSISGDIDINVAVPVVEGLMNAVTKGIEITLVGSDVVFYQLIYFSRSHHFIADAPSSMIVRG